MSHLVQTTVVNKYVGESTEDYEERIQSAIDQSRMWYASHLGITIKELDNLTSDFGSMRPYCHVILDEEGRNIIVSDIVDTNCQKVYIYVHDDHH